MRKFLCIFVALSILSLNVFAFATDTTNCTCCNCQNQDEQTEDDPDSIPGITDSMTQDEIYEAWLTASWSMLYSRYAETTWFDSVSTYESGEFHYLPSSFLLLDSIFTVTEEDINSIVTAAGSYEKDNNLKKLANTRKFINRMPSTADIITSTRSLFENQVPSGYEIIDGLMMDAVNELLEWRNSIPKYIEEHEGTLEGFKTKIPDETKDKIDRLYCVFAVND